MPNLPTVSDVDASAFAEIEAAVMETARGRWFLEEFAKRRRYADTQTVLNAIESLQSTFSARPTLSSPMAIQQDLIDMARTLARTEREMRALGKDSAGNMPVGSASDELGSIVIATEQATSTILSAAERVQECAWTMREATGAAADCDLLDACATDIYTACGFQDLTAQRIAKVTDALRFVDGRIRAILQASGLEESIGLHDGEADTASKSLSAFGDDVWMGAASQAEIDETLDFFVPAAISEPTMVGAELLDLDNDDVMHAPPATSSPAKVTAKAAAEPDQVLFKDIDALSTPEKLRAFR